MIGENDALLRLVRPKRGNKLLICMGNVECNQVREIFHSRRDFEQPRDIFLDVDLPKGSAKSQQQIWYRFWFRAHLKISVQYYCLVIAREKLL